MDPLGYLFLVVIGLGVGIISAMVGVGGGILIVPILMFGYGMENPVASAISTFVIVFTSTSGTLTYLSQKRIDLRTGAFFSLIAVPFAFVGALLADIADTKVLTGILGLLLVSLSIQRIFLGGRRQKTVAQAVPEPHTNQKNQLGPSTTWRMRMSESLKLPQASEERVLTDDKGKEFRYRLIFRKTLFGAAIGGFLSGLLGIGGGVIFVPVFTSIGGMPPHIAVATSTFALMFSAFSGATARLLGGKVLFDYVLMLALGTVVGARIGATKVRKVSSKTVLDLFYLIMLLAGIRAIFQGLGIAI